MSGAAICAKCATETSTNRDGRYGRFVHIACFDAWWRSQYGETGDVYYRWMRSGMCPR